MGSALPGAHSFVRALAQYHSLNGNGGLHYAEAAVLISNKISSNYMVPIQNSFNSRAEVRIVHRGLETRRRPAVRRSFTCLST
jgi:hypothetical protein